MKKVVCPHCKKKVIKKGNPFWPFCTERCKMVDLGKWVTEQYRVAGEPVKTEDDKEEEDDN
ncbi:MAG: DNA gyrase inhibitor YacG [Deltaproteobacteria bacterium RIFCSPLOWO2_01_44_7]|nr:MAG: DNA gyrase inhibitor YacG [Deltaproteobacteria bacterium RIFCSPHIGHO2_01_FULL_43_49]OGQ14762.1 MAG: DNA gyrase inhibitor YacG [Deltaproteobacteria bacterium RIFCSPHIGHO2_02_FULL_44_53]OGQ28148.1 MAG: DNA gyrase inhibitor YacG [Deltaproteobacteria bacterium RIFCSPHIGHO2_12_FULL_44_21]OGQ31360.1 MAG: DNA gyrase inhibitor YacG [Deltaproteobacteria bacterium RIFCSPLOWO2_01_FULL_45_74]OGQ38636.1 MAG: DNA gyrase inhibitor YacG [Deltaproteobacteria bacterium RIFCSPLOWO2_01_44_7]OGQ43352.1 MAG